MVDAWKRGKKSEDEAYFALADKAIELAQAAYRPLLKPRKCISTPVAGYALKARLLDCEANIVP